VHGFPNLFLPHRLAPRRQRFSQMAKIGVVPVKSCESTQMMTIASRNTKQEADQNTYGTSFDKALNSKVT
jgi:hypothetical protein